MPSLYSSPCRERQMLKRRIELGTHRNFVDNHWDRLAAAKSRSRFATKWKLADTQQPRPSYLVGRDRRRAEERLSNNRELAPRNHRRITNVFSNRILLPPDTFGWLNEKPAWAAVLKVASAAAPDITSSLTQTAPVDPQRPVGPGDIAGQPRPGRQSQGPTRLGPYFTRSVLEKRKDCDSPDGVDDQDIRTPPPKKVRFIAHPQIIVFDNDESSNDESSIISSAQSSSHQDKLRKTCDNEPILSQELSHRVKTGSASTSTSAGQEPTTSQRAPTPSRPPPRQIDYRLIRPFRPLILLGHGDAKTIAKPEFSLHQLQQRRKRHADIEADYLRALLDTGEGHHLLVELTDSCERAILFGDEPGFLSTPRSQSWQPNEESTERVYDEATTEQQHRGQHTQRDVMLDGVRRFVLGLPRDIMARIFSKTWHGWSGAKCPRLAGADGHDDMAGSTETSSPFASAHVHPQLIWISGSELGENAKKAEGLSQFLQDLCHDLEHGFDADSRQALTTAACFVASPSFEPRQLVPVAEREKLLPKEQISYSSRVYLICSATHKVDTVTKTLYSNMASGVMTRRPFPSPEPGHVEYYDWSRQDWLDAVFVRKFLQQYATQLCKGASPEREFPHDALQLVCDDLNAALGRRTMPSLMRKSSLVHQVLDSLTSFRPALSTIFRSSSAHVMPGAFPDDSPIEVAPEECGKADDETEVLRDAHQPSQGLLVGTTSDARTQTVQDLPSTPSLPRARSTTSSPTTTKETTRRVSLGLRAMQRYDARLRVRRRNRTPETPESAGTTEDAATGGVNPAALGYNLRWFTRRVHQRTGVTMPKAMMDAFVTPETSMSKSKAWKRAWNVVERRYSRPPEGHASQIRWQPTIDGGFARRQDVDLETPMSQQSNLRPGKSHTGTQTEDMPAQKPARAWQMGTVGMRREAAGVVAREHSRKEGAEGGPGSAFKFPDDDDDDGVGLQLAEAVQTRLRLVVEEKDRERRQAEADERRKREEEEKRRLEAEEEQRRLEAQEKRREKEEEDARKRIEEAANLGPNGMRSPRSRLFPTVQDHLLGSLERCTTEAGEICRTPEGGLTRYDFARLLPPTAWLNDAIVNGALLYLDKAVNEAAGVPDVKAKTRKNLVMTSFFFTTLKKSSGKSTERAMRRVGINPDNFLDVDTILIPVCESSHWTLMVIKPKQRTVGNIDSLHPPGDRGKADVIFRWIEVFLGEKRYKADGWQYMRYHTPPQPNGWDCGVHTILNGMCMALDIDPLEAYTADELADHRRNIAAMLLNGKGFGEAYDLSGC